MPAMRFDLADLSLFRHVVDAGSITRGAERVHLALAAASTRIRNMEEALGAALLVGQRQGGHTARGGARASSAWARNSAPGRAPGRGSQRLWWRARGPNPRVLQYQRPDGVSSR